MLRGHRRLVALAVALLVGLAVLGVAAERSRTRGGCAAPPPVAQVPQQLRTIGGFDQPLPTGDPRGLQDTAIHAASALHSDLSTDTLGDVVTIPAADASGHTAVVVPLLTNPGPDGRNRNVAGLVAFELDCSGQAFLGPVVDLAAAPPTGFPAVSRDSAASVLGGDVELVWRGSPLAPEWRRRGASDCVAATATAVTGCRQAP